MIVLEILILLLLIGVGVGGYFTWRDLKKSISLTKEVEQERYDRMFFEPYLGLIVQDAKIYDKEGNETGGFLPKNSFQTVIFEKNGMCELFSGAGWLKSYEISRHYEKNPSQIPARVKETAAVKSGPSLGYHTITKLPVGTVVEITDRQGCWCKVRAKNLNEGYILAILLDKS